MKFSPFVILLIPLWIYIKRYGINVIRDRHVSLNHYSGLSVEKRTKVVKGIYANIFGYSTLIGGSTISVGLLSTLFSDYAPYQTGLLFVTLCPIGIGINILGLVSSLILDPNKS